MIPTREPAFVNTASAWQAAADAIARTDRLAFDLEADGFHRYPEQVSLMQIGLPDGQIFLVDPLSLDQLDALGETLADPEVATVLHAADYDLRSLDRDFGWRIGGLLDTSVAAQFMGSRRTGLGNVLSDVLDVDLPKPKRLQRLDWSQRPLPSDALDYAAGDVAHLLELAERVVTELQELERVAWLEEECLRMEAIRYEPPDPPEEAFRGLKGARDLSPQQRAVLKEVFVFRDRQARKIGRPPHRVMPNRAVLALAQADGRDPAQVKAVPQRLLRAAGDRLRAAVDRGRTAPPIAWPRPSGHNPWTSDAKNRLAALKRWRRTQAADLDLDVGVVWPNAYLNRLALNPNAPLRSLDDEDPPLIREWQWRNLGDSLDAFRQVAFS